MEGWEGLHGQAWALKTEVYRQPSGGAVFYLPLMLQILPRMLPSHSICLQHLDSICYLSLFHLCTITSTFFLSYWQNSGRREA